ncbi:TIGR04104 family putative zinc finger protein [Thalassobacillus hwangdonensis]|uniref:TIGR04104 family putative zinc finger protein n=1 Tax=Thalassobacillus hwangdonensis TaxID=546108 RepID=A0ABW3L5S4_9BACI
MPHCAHCKRKWTMKDTFFKPVQFKNKMNCPYCGKTQYLSAKSKKRQSMLAFIPPIPLYLATLLDWSLPIFLAICIVLFVAGMAVLPYFYQLKNEEEFIW